MKEGAKYEEHWAFVKPVRPPQPEVRQTAWVKTPIDSFILAKLESHGLAPEPEADRRALIRRVTLDLTGLPPTPEEVSAFLADNSPNAYEKVVDRLLASPHYGEHEARYWLDAARYAETAGLHFDEPRSIWPYRDWVIKAFNDNKRFDEFVVEQVAGDLLPNHTIDQQVATGFTRCGISTSEGGSIEDEVLATYAKEHVETNATTFLGPHHGLLRLPRSQVRPHLPEGVLRVLRLLPEHHATRPRPAQGRRSPFHPRTGPGGPRPLGRAARRAGRRPKRHGRLRDGLCRGFERPPPRDPARSRHRQTGKAGEHGRPGTATAAPRRHRQPDHERGEDQPTP